MCSILGSEGIDLGVSALRGEHAHEVTEEALFTGDALDSVVGSDLLLLSYEVRQDVDPQFLRPLEGAGRVFGKNSSVPVFVSVQHGQQGRPMSRPELRVMAQVLRAVLIASGLGALLPRPWDWRRRMLELELEGKGKKATVIDRVVTCPAPRPESERAVVKPVLSARWNEATRSLPRSESTWGLACFAAPSVANDTRALEVLLVLDEESGLILPPRVIPVGDAEAVADALLDLFELQGQQRTAGPGIPGSIRFLERATMRQFSAILAELDVEPIFDPDQDVLLGAIDGLTLHLEQGIGVSEGAGHEPVHVTLAEWKSANTRLTDRLIQLGRFKTPRPVAMFFGDAEAGMEALNDPDDVTVGAAYLEWFLFNYRTRGGARTVAERLMDQHKLGGVETALLQARAAASLCIGRVASIDPGASLEFENVLTGECTTVHDAAMSMSAVEGLGLILRLYPAGEWTLVHVAGPPVPPMLIGQLVQAVEARGIRIVDGLLEGDLHRLGELFDAPELSPQMPTSNTDGEALEPLVVTFGVSDGLDLASILEGLSDIVEESDTEWTWLVQRPGDLAFRNGVVMGHLELIGQELLIEVNSRERAERATEMLGSIDGLSFERVGESAPSEPGSVPGFPGDSSELHAEVERLVHEQAIAWLDEPVPALEGMTPREAVLVPRLSPLVERMIRTYPDSSGPAGVVRIPREKMMAELGLP